MNDKIAYSKVAVELLEIISFFDERLKSRVPSDFIKKLNKIKSNNYSYVYDKTKSLDEQSMMPETKKILLGIFIYYCCTPRARMEVLEEKNYQVEEYKNQSSQKDNSTSLVDTAQIPWYKKIIDFLKRLLKKQ